jgi:hypothetical protein
MAVFDFLPGTASVVVEWSYFNCFSFDPLAARIRHWSLWTAEQASLSAHSEPLETIRYRRKVYSIPSPIG